MTSVAVWQVASDQPTRLEASQVDLEKDLEGWIETNPDLVRFGLKIIGRQVHLEAGPLDLLALDEQGRFCVIEIKRGAVDRDTIAQVQDYAACLSQISEENLREVLNEHLSKRDLELDALLQDRDSLEALDPQSRQIFMLVVGTARGVGLERVLRFLAGYGVPISAVLFNVFTTSQGEQILIRETAASESAKVLNDKWQSSSVEKIREIAEEGGCADIFDALKQVAEDLGLQSRPWKRRLMFAPQSDGRRCLFTIHAVPKNGQLQVYVETKAFSEFFPVTEAQATDALGASGDRTLDQNSASEFADKLRVLLIPNPDNIQIQKPGPEDGEDAQGSSLF